MIEITTTTSLVRIGISLLLGACIGIERELHNHPAGIRTFSLVTMGSALAMLLSIYVCQQNTDLLNGDPGRIAAQVLTGIGFIGAGLIIKQGEGIYGLTTAACVFISAVIGLAVGAGMIWIGVAVTAAVVIVLLSSNLYDNAKKKRMNRDNDK